MGCHRSGTTLVQAMLAVHPDVISFPETNYVNEVVGDYPCRVPGHPRTLNARSLRTRLRPALGIATEQAAILDQLVSIEGLFADIDRQAT